MNKQTTRVDRLLQGMKDNPVTAALIVLGTVVIALASTAFADVPSSFAASAK